MNAPFLTRPQSDAEALIADRGGANPGYANDPAKLRLANGWVDAARPIIRALLVLDDEAQWPLVEAKSKERSGKRWSDPRTSMEVEYDDTQTEIRKLVGKLSDQLEGIRDAFISDECPGLQDDDAAQDEADDFSDWLREHTTSVDAALRRVADEVAA